jgi:hypothetical protein
MRSNDPDDPRRTTAEPVVEGEQPAPEHEGESDIFGVVGLRPAELVGDAPRLPVKTIRCAPGDRRGQERGERRGGESVRDLTPPP